MTPALKAMVEAMVAEIAAQAWTDPAAELPMLQVDGHLDLEKVARAGLAAIKPTDNIVNEIADDHAELYRTEVEYVWDRVIDEILKERA